LKYVLATTKINKTGNTIPQLTIPMIKHEKIPLPPLKIQREIADFFEKQSEAIQANKQLIDIFESQIKEKISEVWGE